MTDTYIPTEDGYWVSEKFERLAAVIKDYDASLELRWIPLANRTREDKNPYVVVDTRINQVVIYASELDTPVEILEKLWSIDNKHHNVLDKLEIRDRAQKALDYKRHMDELEEAAEMAYFLKQSPLHTIRMNGKKFDHNRRVIE